MPSAHITNSFMLILILHIGQILHVRVRAPLLKQAQNSGILQQHCHETHENTQPG